MSALLELRDLNVFYGAFHSVHGINITCQEGEIVSLIGANGAGKSSTLRAIIGQVPRITGEMRFDGEDMSKCSTPDRIASGIALVPEGRRLFPNLTVEENLMIGVYTGRPGPIGLKDVYAIFPVLLERRKQFARQLSGGQQQMVAIGRALMMNPRLVLFDEISLGLSPKIIGDIYEVLPRIRDRGLSMILVEQDISRALAMADHFVCMLEGRISLAGRPADVTRAQIAASYFGD
ncbi:ABC transporter ATP-binding protein [Celeribacter baekdonensis]|uniref:ABC transporter ATP-binding protein n=1 Tax=Celeribacter baekdonensis TaxID=875171 RepID=A0A2R4LXZ3_9RHOB|nr:ABC transporter ATP-binding protein [Celeribacter baekdonensis]AVW89739.1 ABC transporter ATP-binding protein [Celeribacter baekdonensis]|tara:strand:+ start:48850 stop:49551 length:702 start_codon:yes stop_codon:yes gene_type:complete